MNTWREQAACLGMPIKMFFRDQRPSPFIVNLCQSCAVRQECLADALAQEAELKVVSAVYGYRGGKSARERRTLLTRERKAICR